MVEDAIKYASRHQTDKHAVNNELHFHTCPICKAGITCASSNQQGCDETIEGSSKLNHTPELLAKEFGWTIEKATETIRAQEKATRMYG